MNRSRMSTRHPVMRHDGWLAPVGLLIGAAIVWTATTALAGEDVAILRVKNDIQYDGAGPVNFRIRSQRPYNPNSAWVQRSIEPGATEEISLRSPDSFLAEVHVDGTKYTTRPMALRHALAEKPSGVLRISMVTFDPGSGGRKTPEIEINLYDDSAGFVENSFSGEQGLRQRLQADNSIRGGLRQRSPREGSSQPAGRRQEVIRRLFGRG